MVFRSGLSLRKLLWFTAFFYFFFKLPAQPIVKAHFTIRDGLPASSVAAIHWDQLGYLWVGTYYGLSRFDGYEFINFLNAPQARYRISAESVDALTPFQDSLMLVRFYQNYRYFDIINVQTLETQTVQLTELSTKTRGTIRLVELHPDHQWMKVFSTTLDSTFWYRYCFAGNDLEMVHQWRQPRLSQASSLELTFTEKGSLLLNDSDIGLQLLRRGTGVLKTFINEDFIQGAERSGPLPDAVEVIHTDAQGRTWLAFQDSPGVYEYLPASRQFQLNAHFPSGHPFKRVWEDNNGQLIWMCSDRIARFPKPYAFYRYTPEGRLELIPELAEQYPGFITLHSNDFQNNLLVGHQAGLNFLDANFKGVNQILSRELEGDEWGTLIRGFSSDGDSLIFFAREINNWFAYNRFNEKLDTITIRERDGSPVPFKCGFDLEYDPEGCLWGIACDGNDRGYLFQYDLDKDSSRYFISDAHFYAIYRRLDGTLLLGARNLFIEEGMLLTFDQRSGQFHPYLTRKGINPFLNTRPSFIMEDSKGCLWVGTDQGAFRIQPDIGEVLHFFYG